MISAPAKRLEHRYRLANASDRDVKIVDLVNRKSCCGEVVGEAKTLRPGDQMDVLVKLVVGQKFGDVVHETEVVTDPAAPGGLVLRTLARAFTAIRIEDAPSSSADPQTAEYRVFSSGTPTEPLADLDRLELTSTIPVRWLGPKEDASADDGLTVETRRFVATLDRGGSPGSRTAEISLRNGKELVSQHPVHWDVVAPITASPKLVVIVSSRREYHILLTSHNKIPFRITRIDCPIPGLKARAEGTAAKALQTIVVEVDRTREPNSVRAVLTISTDHPAQGKIEIPIISLD